tara:strand:+ start:143 stop:493 length:351 start_codon:yes stop_codon:yes gene_type:complete
MERANEELLKELQKQLRKSALKMERDAKLNATNFPKVVTGTLRRSITGLVDAPQGKPRVVLKAGGFNSGNDLRYAKYVEFGTRFMRPRLYLGRAVDEELRRLPDRLSNLLNVTLDT